MSLQPSLDETTASDLKWITGSKGVVLLSPVLARQGTFYPLTIFSAMAKVGLFLEIFLCSPNVQISVEYP